MASIAAVDVDAANDRQLVSNPSAAESRQPEARIEVTHKQGTLRPSLR